MSNFSGWANVIGAEIIDPDDPSNTAENSFTASSYSSAAPAPKTTVDTPAPASSSSSSTNYNSALSNMNFDVSYSDLLKALPWPKIGIVAGGAAVLGGLVYLWRR